MAVVAAAMFALLIVAVLLLIAVIVRSNTDRPVMPPPTPVAPQWARDPNRRHDYRFWNGTRWTMQVSDAGVVSTDQ